MWDSKQIGLIIVFTALTIVLDPIRIPSIFLAGVYFRFCEIPIVAAMILFGSKIAISIAILNIAAEAILFPGPMSFINPFFILMLTLSMLFGIHSAVRVLKNRRLQSRKNEIKEGIFLTSFGTLFRTLPAPFLIGFLYRFIIPPVLGINLTDTIVIGLMPFFGLYAVIFSLYTIPIGYFIARTIARNLKVSSQY